MTHPIRQAQQQLTWLTHCRALLLNGACWCSQTRPGSKPDQTPDSKAFYSQGAEWNCARLLQARQRASLAEEARKTIQQARNSLSEAASDRSSSVDSAVSDQVMVRLAPEGGSQRHTAS